MLTPPQSIQSRLVKILKYNSFKKKLKKLDKLEIASMGLPKLNMLITCPS